MAPSSVAPLPVSIAASTIACANSEQTKTASIAGRIADKQHIRMRLLPPQCHLLPAFPFPFSSAASFSCCLIRL